MDHSSFTPVCVCSRTGKKPSITAVSLSGIFTKLLKTRKSHIEWRVKVVKLFTDFRMFSRHEKVSVTKQCRHRPPIPPHIQCVHYDWQLSCSLTDSCTVNVYFNCASCHPWPSPRAKSRRHRDQRTASSSVATSSN